MHQGSKTAFTYDEAVRICTHSGCTRWNEIFSDSTPPYVDPSTLPYELVSGHGLTMKWKALAVVLRLQWRYTQVQSGADVAETKAQIGTS